MLPSGCLRKFGDDCNNWLVKKIQKREKMYNFFNQKDVGLKKG